ncbi:MAG: HAD-IC family P-type ATPase [Candidatus Pacebacteria bacterium]|nr:HAD-IC family P-type ATPase [Candidatus Paceibacterota bacterium]
MIELHNNDLVVGDVIRIEPGKTVPVDGLLIEGKDVTTDESAMTGESHELKKCSLKECDGRIKELGQVDEMTSHDIPTPVLLSGTKVIHGEGLYLAIVVGPHSAIGSIMSKIMQKSEASPLQKKLEAIAEDIGKLGFYTAVLTVVIMLLRFFITRAQNGNWDSKDVTTCLTYFLNGLTIVVVAIPEGLPLAVTIALAYSVQRMYAENNFVKTLMSCETMGGATTICSDKTGTLTENQMRVLKYFVNSKVHILDPRRPKYEWDEGITQDQREYITEAICVNSTATDRLGNPTEKAFVEMIARYGVNWQERRKAVLGDYDYFRFEFSSSRKKMSTIVKQPYKWSGNHRLYIKGASEIVLQACDHVMVGDIAQPLKPEGKAEVEAIMKRFNMDALRTLTVAYKDIKLKENGDKHDEKDSAGRNQVEESGLTLLGVFGIRDTIRAGVREAVDLCRKAGIKVRMVTGDNRVTAAAIAKECHILPESFTDDVPDSFVVTEGPKFHELLQGLVKVCAKCKTEQCDCGYFFGVFAIFPIGILTKSRW